MIEVDDYELLAQYAGTESEVAFATLVARYVNLVHSAALRFTGNGHYAQEITQAVFVILARKAGSLRRGTVLSGWLYQAARLTAANFMKGENRRQRREQEAYMQSTLTGPDSAAWEQIAPLLDEAMGWLCETLKIMTYAKLKLAAGIGAGIILAGGATTVGFSSGGTGTDLAAGEILKQAQEKYASLTSYSDEGKTVATINGRTFTTTFSIKLARPGFYLIEWEQPVSASYTNKGAVWSAGEGDFLRMGSRDRKEAKQETALASATGISGGAAASIPGTFFSMNWGNQLGGAASSAKRGADEKVGDVVCYVFTSDLKGQTRTLWIGKEDLLIHQVRTVTSAAAMEAVQAEAAKRNPEIAARQPKSKPQGITSTETHENIVVNQKLADKDFVPPAAAEQDSGKDAFHRVPRTTASNATRPKEHDAQGDLGRARRHPSGAMKLLLPLVEAGLVRRLGTKKSDDALPGPAGSCSSFGPTIQQDALVHPLRHARRRTACCGRPWGIWAA
jgi:outer membrane lipoprotein-sorting protein